MMLDDTNVLLLLPLQLLPSLNEASRKCDSDGESVNCILTDTAAALTDEFSRSIQVHIKIHSLYTNDRGVQSLSQLLTMC